MATREEMLAEAKKRGLLGGGAGASTEQPTARTLEILAGPTTAPEVVAPGLYQAMQGRGDSPDFVDDAYYNTPEQNAKAMEAIETGLTVAGAVPVAGAAARGLSAATKAALAKGAAKVAGKRGGPQAASRAAPRANLQDSVADVARRYPGPKQRAPFSRVSDPASGAAEAAASSATGGLTSPLQMSGIGATIGVGGELAEGDVEAGEVVGGALRGAAAGAGLSQAAKSLLNTPLGRSGLIDMATKVGMLPAKHRRTAWHASNPSSRAKSKELMEELIKALRGGKDAS